jgi:hypothetical protein
MALTANCGRLDNGAAASRIRCWIAGNAHDSSRQGPKAGAAPRVRRPAVGDYRYIERDNRTYVIEPRERTIIEEIE